jgi:hypothetical protein
MKILMTKRQNITFLRVLVSLGVIALIIFVIYLFDGHEFEKIAAFILSGMSVGGTFIDLVFVRIKYPRPYARVLRETELRNIRGGEEMHPGKGDSNLPERDALLQKPAGRAGHLPSHRRGWEEIL